jgi:ribosomal protein S18 acetylase RimI-like enzyme
MLYRAAEEKDLQALQTLGLVAYGQLKPYLTDANWMKMQEVIKNDNNFPSMLKNCFGFVCEEENHLLGMAFLVPSGNPTKVFSAETSYIRMVGVHPDAVGKGIAQSLTRLCIEKAKQNGEKTICLHTAEVMVAARHVYEKLGFKKIRQLESNYNLQYWLYQLDLA